jgi:CDP-glucose 4,6-dehydratase
MTSLSFYKGRKVFITGHTGFKGAWLCRVLLHAGAGVTGYALDPPEGPSLFEQLGVGDKIKSGCGHVFNEVWYD